MKKVVRTIWISLLSGLAFLSACGTSKSGSRAERRQLVRERDSIQEILDRRENACVYGSPEVIEAYGAENARLRGELDELNGRINDLDDPDKTNRRNELQQQLDSLQDVLKRRESACVYGSPEVMQRYRQQTDSIRQQANKIQQELEQLDEEQ